jgi:hypothetical protein
MTADLFGKPLGGYPEVTLNIQQKRHAALLYHWMSLDYLRDLKKLLDTLINGADVNLELAKIQGRDALLTSKRWGVRDTSANWSTFVFPALEDFRKSTIGLIAWRASENYCGTGATQCARMIEEFSSLWMTEEEEKRFKEQFDKVYQHAQFIDFAAGVGGRRPLDDSSMAGFWRDSAHLFPALPKFRVRTDVEAVSGKLPLRSGVWVAQDDPLAVLQFAWTGNADGVLGEARTYNEIGRRAVSSIGRDAIWTDAEKMAAYTTEGFKRGELTDYDGFKPGDERDPRWAGAILGGMSFTARACRWYFVEKIEGEWDDLAGEGSAAPTTSNASALRCKSGEPCSRDGHWFTPARPNSRRSFKQGEVMPELGGDYGATIWQWDEQQ